MVMIRRAQGIALGFLGCVVIRDKFIVMLRAGSTNKRSLRCIIPKYPLDTDYTRSWVETAPLFAILKRIHRRDHLDGRRRARPDDERRALSV